MYLIACITSVSSDYDDIPHMFKNASFELDAIQKIINGENIECPTVQECVEFIMIKRFMIVYRELVQEIILM